MRLALMLLLISGLACKAQKPGSSLPEKCWALWHPVAALRVKRISQQATPVYEQLRKTFADAAFVNGGRPDAFRHVFFMAAFAQKVKPRKLRKLGKAHEKGNYRGFLKGRNEEGEPADSLGSVMDLYNNETGFAIGRSNRQADLNELAALAKTAINAGKALMMKRQKNGTYLDCGGQPVDLARYKGKWFVPKCLVASNTL